MLKLYPCAKALLREDIAVTARLSTPIPALPILMSPSVTSLDKQRGQVTSVQD